ncbi:MAG: family peptidase [Bacteroidetes bacterium]|nr:family peptidase [Bacteroidota bacterium]
MSLHITPIIREQIIHDALSTFPNECCGFLFGIETGDNRAITDIQVVNNAKTGDKRRRFEITPHDYFRAERYAEANALLLLGIYHSHPNHPSVPSEHDRVAAQPYFSYVIVSVSRGEFRTLQSWRLNDDSQFEEETVLHHEFSHQS